MHVGVKKIVPEHLREENLHAVLRELRDIGAARAQFVDVAHDDAVDALHDHDVDAAIIPVDHGNVEQRRAGKIALQLRGVARLAHQIEFIEDRLAIFAHHLDRAQPARLLPILVRQNRKRVQHLEIALDDFVHPGAQYFHDDFVAALELGRMHLRDRGGGERGPIEARENIRRAGGR